MGKIDYRKIYETNKDEWKALTREPQKYEALLAGHYSDSNHFVYELLQNAEDAFERDENGRFNPETCAHADKVVIEYYQDKLIFYHNGKPFIISFATVSNCSLFGFFKKSFNCSWFISVPS